MFLFQPNTPERTISITRGPSLNRKVDTTIDHVDKGGLPVNAKVLDSIRQKIGAGVFNSDRASLVRELKTDPGLYIYSAKNLHRFVDAVGGGISPDEDLFRITNDNLVTLFDVSESDISVHKTRTMSAAQALRLQHSVISSNCADVMATKVHLNSGEAFSGALFRQLGLNLIAWNYPEQYRQALRAQKKGVATIEHELERLLGVRPVDIATRLTANWGIKTEIRKAVGAETSTFRNKQMEDPYNPNKLGLEEVCGLAELFARANDPEHYPDAEKSWHAAEESVKKTFGGEVISVVTKRVEGSLEKFEEVAPTKFKPTLVPRVVREGPHLTKGELLFNANTYVRRCPVEIANKFQDVYGLMQDNIKVSIESLKKLAEEVVLSVGFLRGCLYILDEGDLKINPALRFGDKGLNSYQSFRMHQNNLITASIDSQIPVMQQGKAIDDKVRTQLCGALGSARPQGVLYLELMNDFFESSVHDPLLYFHSVRIALMDCLCIERGKQR